MLYQIPVFCHNLQEKKGGLINYSKKIKKEVNFFILLFSLFDLIDWSTYVFSNLRYIKIKS